MTISVPELRRRFAYKFAEHHRSLQHSVENATGWKDHVWHMHSGEPSVYHYQQKCHHQECRSENRLYYHRWRTKKG